MARAVHPHAMTPSRPGRTRTAPPQAPTGWFTQPRMFRYLLFDATGLVYLLCGIGALRAVWLLGSGPTAWERFLRDYATAPMILLHVICLAAVIFVGVRFFRLFPKSQPAKIGPAKPPPRPIIHAALYAVWIAVSGTLALIMAGGLF